MLRVGKAEDGDPSNSQQPRWRLGNDRARPAANPRGASNG